MTLFSKHELWHHKNVILGLTAYPSQSAILDILLKLFDLSRIGPSLHRADWDHRLWIIFDTSSLGQNVQANYFGNPCFNRRTRRFDRPPVTISIKAAKHWPRKRD